MRPRRRGDIAIAWIEEFCIIPHGPDQGRHVRLTPGQRDLIRRVYSGAQDAPVTGIMAAYLALLHVCGSEALQKTFRPELTADIFTTWNAAGPDLRDVLRREGERIVCPELGTRYPAAA
jgi:hypothetical protein